MELGLSLSLVRLASSTSLAALVAALFSASQPGVFYDPSDLTSLYQTSTGTTPVTSHNDPVGLMLDKRLMSGKTAAAFIESQPELSPYAEGFSSVSGITGVDANVSLDGTDLVITSTTVIGSGVDRAEIPFSGLTVGLTYRVVVRAKRGDQGAQQSLSSWTFATVPATAVATTSAVDYTFVVPATATSGVIRAYSGLASSAAGDILIVESISVKAIPGNHATQATSSARPVYKTEPHPDTDYSGQTELVANGTFDTDITGWNDGSSAGGAIAWNAAGKLDAVYTSGVVRFNRAIATTVGKRYLLTANKNATAGALQVGTTVGSGASNGDLYIGPHNADNTYTFFVATSTTTYIGGYRSTSGTFTVDDISVKEVPATARYIHWIEGDGVDDFLRATFTITQPWDRISAIRQVSWLSGEQIFGGVSGNNGVLNQITSSPIINMFNGSGGISSGAAAIGADVVVTEHFEGANSRLAVNATAYETGTLGTGDALGLTIFGTSTGSGLTQTRLYPVVMREGTLTDAQIARLRTLIGAKAGLTL